MPVHISDEAFEAFRQALDAVADDPVERLSNALSAAMGSAGRGPCPIAQRALADLAEGVAALEAHRQARDERLRPARQAGERAYREANARFAERYGARPPAPVTARMSWEHPSWFFFG
jgi:hypothetical protein